MPSLPPSPDASSLRAQRRPSPAARLLARARGVRLGLAIVVLAALGCSDRGAAEPIERTLQARPAEAFVDSVGVNVHLHYTDSPYTSYDDAERAARFNRLRDALRDLGVRHVRDGLIDTAWPAYYAQHNRLHRELGVRSTLVLPGDWRVHELGDQAFARRVLDVAGRFEGVATLEGYNEYDLFHGNREDWTQEVRKAQRALRDAARSSDALAGVTVLGPSLVRPGSYREVGDVSAWMDCGSFHPYPGGSMPEQTIGREVDRQRPLSTDRPLQATEAGYHNALATEHGHRPTSEAAEAIYLPRMFFEHFRLGILRTFDYELISTHDRGPGDVESHFGLIRHDGSRTPAFLALQRTMAVLSEGNNADEAVPAAGAPAALTYRRTGGGDDLREVLLAQPDGRLVLAVWRAVSVWDPDARQALGVQPQRLVFGWPQGRFERVRVFRPSVSYAAQVEQPGDAELVLNLTSDLHLIELTPTQAQP